MKRNLSLIFALILLLTSAFDTLALAADDSEYRDLTVDIPYINDGNENHMLDVYSTKEKAEPTKTVVEIHGGGFCMKEGQSSE